MSDLWIAIHGFKGFRPAAHTWQQLLQVTQAWLFQDESNTKYPGLMVYEIATSETHEKEPYGEFPYFVFRTYRDAEIRLLCETRCE